MLNKKPLSVALGVSFVVSLAATPLVNAESNPFEMTDLSTGYMVADGHKDGKCGEGKCGENKKAEGKCGSKAVDMQGNVVELDGVFTYGGDNMAGYASGKLGTGAKDPGVCGSYASDKCSVGHLQK